MMPVLTVVLWYIIIMIVQIDKMEAKVVKPLLEYEVVCKKAKVRAAALSLYNICESNM